MSTPRNPDEARRAVRDALIAAYEADTGAPLSAELRTLIELLSAPAPMLRRAERGGAGTNPGSGERHIEAVARQGKTPAALVYAPRVVAQRPPPPGNGNMADAHALGNENDG